jgi:hypothetical protein|tara:strand:+ start:402 stop:536 length:135 start_codon:yes stop_codon:yes gene_type:complete
MFQALKLNLRSMAVQTARLARDMWNSVNLNDLWENEHRQWEDII